MAREMIDPVAEELGIRNLYRVKASTLSAGQLHKVALARALALNPRYLILDEPFAHLDEEGIIKLKNLLERIIKSESGRTVVVATHFGEIVHGKDYVVLKMSDGKVLQPL